MNLLQSKGKKFAKSILKEVLPPFIIKMARKSLTESNCSGTYGSYSEAALTCADSGYEQDDLIAVVLEKTKRYKNSINTSQYLEPDIQDTRLLLAIFQACNTTQHNTTQHNTTQYNTSYRLWGGLWRTLFFCKCLFQVKKYKTTVACGRESEYGISRKNF